MVTTRVGKRGTVVTPAALRRQLGLREGTVVVAEPREGGVLFTRVESVSERRERHRQLLEDTNRAYAALQANPVAWQEELAERALWDAMLLDGLEDEEPWIDEGAAGATTSDCSDLPGAGRNLAG